MPIPSNWTLAILTGRFVHVDGSPLVGAKVHITPAPDAIPDPVAEVIVVGTAQVVVLDDTGWFSAPLLLPSTPGLTRTDWTYEIVEPPQTGRRYSITIPADTLPAAVIDLSSVAPAPAPLTGVVQLVEGPPGPPGPAGPPGDGVTTFFIAQYVQTVPQSVWTVTHAAGIPVSWSLRTAADQLATGYIVDPIDSTHTRISMDVPTAGTVRLLLERV